MVNERFDRIEADEEQGARPVTRLNLLRDCLRRQVIVAAEDPSLADPDHHWHRIRGGTDGD